MRDSDVRSAVRAKLHSVHEGESSTLVVEEMGVWANSVRIDIAVVNGEMAGFELKSDRDTLERLPLQAKIYSRVFDRLTLVVGERHLKKAIPIIPRWWGVIEARQRGEEIELITCRDARLNPRPDPRLVAALLWRDESIDVLARYDLAKGWRSRGLDQLHHRLSTELPFEVLKQEVRDCLKARRGWLRQN